MGERRKELEIAFVNFFKKVPLQLLNPNDQPNKCAILKT
jgi:hypothetical protein